MSYNMEIKFFNASEFGSNLKLTLHKTGKLGFSMDAIKTLNIAGLKSASIGKNPADNNSVLYMLLHAEEVHGAFDISKAGSYYYINTKGLFDKLGINYSAQRNKLFTYDILETGDKIGESPLYKLVLREENTTPANDDTFPF